eukprot:433612-Pelagomonas_calceolata.AAC.1
MHKHTGWNVHQASKQAWWLRKCEDQALQRASKCKEADSWTGSITIFDHPQLAHHVLEAS